MAGDSEDDPFETWRFDDEFVRGAALSEASAEERLGRLRRVDAILARLWTQHELDLADVVAGRPVGRRGRRPRVPRFSTVMIIAFTLVIGIYTVKDGLFSDEGAQSFVGGGTGDVLGGSVESGLPAAPVDEADAPLGRPAEFPAAPGEHAFVATQPGGSAPVAYDPCQPIHYVVNWATAPTDTGAGGSTGIERNGHGLYVTGQVALDGPQLTEVAGQMNDDGVIVSTIIHELGHLVGLDHVDDESQIMNPYTVPGIESFATGDLAGLAQLGSGECFPGV